MNRSALSYREAASSTAVKVRLATAKDLLQLGELVRKEAECQQEFSPWLSLTPGLDWADYVARKLHRPHAAVFVAEQDDALVGYIEVRVIDQGRARSQGTARQLIRRILYRGRKEPAPLFQPRLYGFIEDIYLDPAVRRSTVGIGYKLLHQGLDWLRSQGVTEVEGAVWLGNEDVLDLARRLGFQQARVLVRKKL